MKIRERRDWLIPALGIAALLVISVSGAIIAYFWSTGQKVVYPDDPWAKTVHVNPALRGLNIQTYTQTYDADTQYLGRCAVVTPPVADPCDAVAGELRYGFWSAVVNANQFKTWKNQNPGEYARLTAHMQAPNCPNGSAPAEDMLTFYGAYLHTVVNAYACAAGANGGAIGQIAWPTPNPALDPNRTDKKPPSAPGPITVTPNP